MLSGSVLATAIGEALESAGVFAVIEEEAQRAVVKALTVAAWQPIAVAILAHITSAGVVTIAPGAAVMSGEVVIGAVTGVQTGTIS